MERNLIGRGKPRFLVWAALLLGAVGACLWLWLAQGDSIQVLASAFLMATALLGMVGQSRAHAARRWQAALDAYAEHELSQLARGKVRQKVTTVAAGGVSQRS
jgi:hypothetical protein